MDLDADAMISPENSFALRVVAAAVAAVAMAVAMAVAVAVAGLPALATPMTTISTQPERPLP
jgi:hypothetical protein